MTDVQTATAPIQIVFPEVNTGKELMLPPAPSTAVNTGIGRELATRPVAQVQQVLRCSALLVGDSLENARRDAAVLYPKMVGDFTQAASTATFMAYGQSSLDGVNRLIDEILAGQEPIKIPEVMGLMKDLNKGMRGIQAKYDVSDPKVREKYEHWSDGVKGWFRRGRTLVEMLMEDIRSIEDQLDRVEDQLSDKADLIVRNVAWYDQLYVANEAEIGKVIYAIAVMELIRDMAVDTASKITVGNDKLGDRQGEDKARLVEFAGLMDQKISAYKGRLFIAWATSPNVRTMRSLDVGVAEKINETITVTIPTMKATLAQWRMLAQAVDASKLAEMVNENANQWLTAFAAASTAGVTTIAQSNNTPLIAPQTVAAMAQSIADQADAVVQAMHDGFERRAALDKAILEGKAVINSATNKISEEFVQAYVDKATKPVEVVREIGHVGSDV